MNYVAHFYLRDDDTRRFINWQLNREAELKAVEKMVEGEYFFDWKAPRRNP